MRGSNDSPMSVVVADPHRQQRERIRGIVDAEPDLEVSAVGASRDHATELLWELWPDAVVIDVGLLSACEHPLAGWGSIPGQVRLIAVGPAEDPWLRSTLRAVGFSAYLSEDRLEDELCDTVRDAVAGDRSGAHRTGRFERLPTESPIFTATAASARRLTGPVV